MSGYAEFCPTCAKTGNDTEPLISHLKKHPEKYSPEKIELNKQFWKGYSAAIKTNMPWVSDYTDICPFCGSQLIKLPVTKEEMLIIDNSTSPNFDYELRDFLVQLKSDNPEEFQKRITQLKAELDERQAKYKAQRQQEIAAEQAEKAAKEAAEKACVPKCPTCGSTKVERINGARCWLSVGLFGRASSDFGKTMHCKNCDYKW